jgi:hypothetical protein
MSDTDSLTLVLMDSMDANNILERNTHTVEELKDALKLLKKAAKNLSASITLMKEGCYTVATKPEGV